MSVSGRLDDSKAYIGHTSGELGSCADTPWASYNWPSDSNTSDT